MNAKNVHNAMNVSNGLKKTLRMWQNLCCLFLFLLWPMAAWAQGAAPALFGVNEVVIEYTHFDDSKAADACGLSREQLASTLAEAFSGKDVPVTPIASARPYSQGLSRVELIPDISTYTDENLNCVSWISLSAEDHVNAVIPPVNTLRSVGVVYWQQKIRVASGQSTHADKVNDVLKKMTELFAQQYKIDQPTASSH